VKQRPRSLRCEMISLGGGLLRMVSFLARASIAPARKVAFESSRGFKDLAGWGSRLGLSHGRDPLEFHRYLTILGRDFSRFGGQFAE